MNNFEKLDWIFIISYFGLISIIGMWVSRRKKTSNDYFLAGKKMSWLAVGASLFAANISSEHYIGLAGSGATSGLAVGNFEWLAIFALLLLGWLFVPFYLRSGVFTMPEFLEKRYGKSCRMYLTSVSIISYIITKMSVTIFAVALLLNFIMGWNMVTSSILLVIVTGLYTIAGGLESVVYTSIIQTLLLIVGASILTIFGLKEVGWIAGLREKVPSDFFSMFKPINHPDFPWTGIMFGAPILGVWYWCTDQYIVQRVLGAKNIQHARAGTILASYLKLLPVFILVLPGIIAVAMFPGVKSDQAFPMLVSSYLLPAGLKGLVIAGLLAALMSSLASCFNSISTLFTMDLYTNLRYGAGEKELVLVGRLATTAMVILSILWIPFIRSISSQLFVYLQSVQAYIAPPITAVFIIGILWRRANNTGAFTTLIFGAIVGMLRLVLEILWKKGLISLGPLAWFVQMNFLHFAILLFLTSILIMYSGSLFSRKTDIYKSKYIEHSIGRNCNFKLNSISNFDKYNLIFSVIVVSLLVVLWIVFR